MTLSFHTGINLNEAITDIAHEGVTSLKNFYGTKEKSSKFLGQIIFTAIYNEDINDLALKAQIF